MRNLIQPSEFDDRLLYSLFIIYSFCFPFYHRQAWMWRLLLCMYLENEMRIWGAQWKSTTIISTNRHTVADQWSLGFFHQWKCIIISIWSTFQQIYSFIHSQSDESIWLTYKIIWYDRKIPTIFQLQMNICVTHSCARIMRSNYTLK